MKIAGVVLALSLCLPATIFSLAARPPHITAASGAGGQDPPKQSSTAQTGSSQDKPTGQKSISVSVDLVNLQALVTDKKGNIITGLRPENFTIYEDNVKQEITNFAPVEAGITAVLVVDFSKVVDWFIMDVWNAIYTFADSLRKGDWVAVIGYDIRPTILTDFTQNRNQLMDALSRFTTPAFSESNLSDAVIFTLDRVEEVQGKVAVILVSTGLDTFSQHTYDDAMKKCKAANASIYAISVGESVRIRYNMDNIDWFMARTRLTTFAELTGGEAYFPRFPSEFPAIFKDISNSLRNEYSIGYVSSNTKRDGKYRKLRVEAKADLSHDGKLVDLKVQTRQGYTAKAR